MSRHEETWELNPRGLKGEIAGLKWRNNAANVLVFLRDGHCLARKKICQAFVEREDQFAEWGAKLWIIWR